MTRWAARAGVVAMALASACGGPPASSGGTLPSGPWGQVTAKVDLGVTAGTPVYGDGYLWIPDQDHGALWKLDPRSNRVVAHITIGDRQALISRQCGPPTVHAYPIGSFSIRACDLPPAVAVAPGAVWVIRTDDDTVIRLDPRTDRVVASIAIGVPGWDLAVTPTDVWVTSYFTNTVVRVDALTNRVAAVLSDVPHGPTGIAVGLGAVWVASSRTAGLVKIDPATNRIVDTIPLNRGPLYTLSRPLPVAIAFGSVWTRLEYFNQLLRIDPRTDGVVARMPVETFYGKDGLDNIGVGAGRLWISGLTVEEVDPGANRVARRLPLTGMTVNYAAGSLWALDVGGPLYRVNVRP